LKKAREGEEPSTSLAVTGRANRNKIAARDQPSIRKKRLAISQFDDIEALTSSVGLEG
jgi:hypothetical protein